MNQIMLEKAKQAQVCYEDLMQKIGETPDREIIFCSEDGTDKQMLRACYKNNPFPGVVKLVLLSLRKKAVKRLYEAENVLQTGPAAAILAMDNALALDVSDIRNGNTGSKLPVYCNVDFAGLQVIRLYMSAYTGSKEFAKSRYNSAIRVDNALNGSFYKYKTKDGRNFSAHVYYESQKKRMMETLGITKAPEKFTFGSLSADKKITAAAVAKWDALELEKATFDNGACGCMLRDRKEWEETEVGRAVCEMPLYRFTKVNDAPKKDFGKADPKKGPLSGVKVLDLTHIIAGPACTRLLAEYGADVLMVRRGDFLHQEQAMLELDGWAGKNSIQLDFNVEDQLARAKELVKEADIVICSYQNGALNKFGLSEADIRELNPSVIFGSLVCFSDTVWQTYPGWAPCAEDITGLSVRNGSLENPVNLNGVPLDYIPGMILFSGIMKALKLQLTEGGGYTVRGSLTRGGYWLHECTDVWDAAKANPDEALKNAHSTFSNESKEVWSNVVYPVSDTAVGTVYFPAPATYADNQEYIWENMKFKSGNTGFKSEK